MVPLDERGNTQPLKAARRLENLVGRDEDLQHIEDIFNRSNAPVVVYLEGPGGIGKTALLQAIRLRLEKNQGYVVVKELIDLYHVEHQSRIGIIQSIVRNLGKQFFTNYQEVYETLQKRISSGIDIAENEWQKIWDVFLEDLKYLAKEKPVLIALDTAEVLGYEQDRFQRDMGLELSELTVGKWLVDTIILQSQGRVLWLLSGRPVGFTLYDYLLQRNKQGAIQLEKLEVQSLNADASRQYFEAVIEFLLKSGKPLEAERIRNTLQQSQESLYDLSEGRPILLALIADILSQGGSLPELKNDARLRRAQALLQNLLRLNHPLGITLRTMAYLPKGVDKELLRRAIKIVEGESISPEEAAKYLDWVGNLVLVKKYASPLKEAERYFLHDELYELFERYQDNVAETRRQLLPEINDYYTEQDRRILDDLSSEPSWERKDLLQRWRNVLKVERIYYQLLSDFNEGTDQYFLLAEDWMDARQRDAYLMLYTNIRRAIQSLSQGQLLEDHQVDMFELNSAVRLGMGKLLFDDDPENALVIFDRIEHWTPFQQTRIKVPDWHLRLYKAVACIWLSKRDEAAGILREIEEEIRKLENQRRAVPKPVNLLQALTYHYLGYLSRLGQDYYSAIESYRKAIAGFKQLQVGMLISAYEHLIYAMAQVGYSRRGRQVFYEAIGLVKRQGYPLWAARLENVMVVLETLDGHFQEAIEHGKKALRELQQTPNQRWESLFCINLARTYRHLWNRSVSLREWRVKWPETLKKAYELLETKGACVVLGSQLNEQPTKALTWLRGRAQQGRSEEIYYVEALVEGGCIQREMAWLYRQYKASIASLESSDSEWGEWSPICEKAESQAEAYFFEAAGLAKYLKDWCETQELSEPIRRDWKQAVERQIERLDGGRYWPVLALVNLAWHWRYQRRVKNESIEALCKLIEELIPSDYHLPKPAKERDKPGTEILLWAVLGKMEMLRFDVSVKFEEWQAKETLDAEAQQELKERLKRAILHLIYSLEYNRLLGEAAFDRGRAEDGLTERLIMIEQHQRFVIPWLYQYDEDFVRDIEREYGNEEAGNQVTFPSELRRWLEERFGGPDAWKA